MNIAALVDRLGPALDRVAKVRRLGSRDAAAAHLLLLGLELEARTDDAETRVLVSTERAELARNVPPK